MNDIEQKMKRLEAFHGARVIDDAWFVVRLDGRNFSKLTKKEFNKPFDTNLKKMMSATAETLFEEFGCIYAFSVSDEISLLFNRDFKQFDRQVEKLTSLTAAAASSCMTLLSQKRIQFDSRITVLPNEKCVAEYFRWRQDDGFRNSLNDVAFWTIVNSGNNEDMAQRQLNGSDYEKKITLLFSHNINFFEMPTEHRRGTGFIWETYQKEGYDPKLKMPVTTDRRRIKRLNDLPSHTDYEEFISQIIK